MSTANSTFVEVTIRMVHQGHRDANWMGFYRIQDGGLIWQGHPEDLDPPEFLDLCHRMGMNPNAIDRATYVTDEEGGGLRGTHLPNTIDWTKVRGDDD